MLEHLLVKNSDYFITKNICNFFLSLNFLVQFTTISYFVNFPVSHGYNCLFSINLLFYYAL